MAITEGTVTRSVPTRALWISGMALVVPMIATLLVSETLGESGALLWLLALVPAFLLAYYRGWRGAATALAVGMAALSITQAVASGTGVVVPDVLLGVVIAYIAIALAIGSLAERMHRDKNIVETMAYTDGLTRLPNRRHARMFLENEFAAAGRGRVLSVVLFDLDHFKQYNDRYGHPMGDEALKAFADVLARTTRRMNLSARLGGEEFISILAGSETEGAMVFAERVRAGMRSRKLGQPPLTVSAGVATFHPGMRSADEILAAADHALYQAKRAGRNRVKLFGRATVDGGDDPPMLQDWVEDEDYHFDPEEIGKQAPPPSLLPTERSGFGRGRTVLVLDDEDAVRDQFVQFLESESFTVQVTSELEEAVDALSTDFDVVIASLGLVLGGTHDLVTATKSRWPTTQVVILTLGDLSNAAVEAVRAGADRVFRRPLEPELARGELANCFARRDRAKSERLEHTLLSMEAAERDEPTWADVLTALESLRSALEARDPDTVGHGHRTAAFATAIAAHVDSDAVDQYGLEIGCRFHDIGKLGIPRAILTKPGPLEDSERHAMQVHVHHGRRIVEPILANADARAVVNWHHERWDGSGYPDRLSGTAIPMAARIAAVADTLAALVAPRVYRPARDWTTAVSEVRAGFGSQFDPGLEGAFDAALEALERIHRETEVAAD